MTIDLGALLDNWRWLRDHVAPAHCAAVVKADAYGLGQTWIAPMLAAAGCEWFFVSQLEEAIELKRIVPGKRVVVLGGIRPDNVVLFVRYHIVPTLNHLGEIALWQQHAKLLDRHLPAVVHFDTGINRLGLEPREIEILLSERDRLEGLQIITWMSHFACADDHQASMTEAQYQRLQTICTQLPPAPISLANSSGILRDRRFHLDLVRPGCALYGINPTPETTNPMHHVITLEARILQVRTVDSSMSVGYGAAHRIRTPSKIATISLGYADGYLRYLGHHGTIAIEGYLAHVVGRISMDLITVDVTTIPESVLTLGRFVEVIGPHRTVDDVAAEAQTIGHEILTNLGHRYCRHYRIPTDPSWVF